MDRWIRDRKYLWWFSIRRAVYSYFAVLSFRRCPFLLAFAFINVSNKCMLLTLKCRYMIHNLYLTFAGFFPHFILRCVWNLFLFLCMQIPRLNDSRTSFLCVIEFNDVGSCSESFCKLFNSYYCGKLLHIAYCFSISLSTAKFFRCLWTPSRFFSSISVDFFFSLART